MRREDPELAGAMLRSRQLDGKPPGRARPPWPLQRRCGLNEDLIDVVGHPACRVVSQPGPELPLEVVVRGHAGRPSEISGSVRASASSAARIEADAAVESRLHRSEREAEGAGHLGERQVEEVVQDDDGSLLGVQPDEAAFDLVAIGDQRLMVGGNRRVKWGDRQVDPMAAQTPSLVDARTNKKPVEPAVEAVRIPKRGQITPGSHQRVLYRVGRLFGVPEDEPGGGIRGGRSRRLPARRRRRDRLSALAPRGLAASRPSAMAGRRPRSGSMADGGRGSGSQSISVGRGRQPRARAWPALRVPSPESLRRPPAASTDGFRPH